MSQKMLHFEICYKIETITCKNVLKYLLDFDQESKRRLVDLISGDSLLKTRSWWRLKWLLSKPINFIRETKITRPRDHIVLMNLWKEALYVTTLLMFGGHSCCGIREKIFLICHLNSCGQKVVWPKAEVSFSQSPLCQF